MQGYFFVLCVIGDWMLQPVNSSKEKCVYLQCHLMKENTMLYLSVFSVIVKNLFDLWIEFNI